MSADNWYHQWFLQTHQPGILYITTNGQSAEPPFILIGNSRKIDWLENRLAKHPTVPVNEVFYLPDVQAINYFLSSEWMQDRMNAKIDTIKEGANCKIRELLFHKPVWDKPKLVLFHEFFDRDESDEFLRYFIRKDDGSINTNFWSSPYVGEMLAISSKLEKIELIAPPKQLEEKYDYAPACPKHTLGDILAPLLKLKPSGRQ